MADTYYNSQLTALQIESALEAVNGLIVPANNGKVIAVENGVLVAKTVQDVLPGSGTIVQSPVTFIENYKSYISNQYKLYIGSDGYPNYRTIAIPLSLYEGYLIHIYNAYGNRNRYGLFAQNVNSQSGSVYSGYQTALNGNYFVYVDASVANKGYLVYDYTNESQEAPIVTGYQISFS